jgi:predicted O-methyltransferase YrrM
MNLELSKKVISGIDLSYLKKDIARKDLARLINQRPGKQHYKLLAYLSIQIGGQIIELGTHHGTSALALCHNAQAKITTWDISDKYSAIGRPNNLHRRTGNILEIDPLSLLLADLIFLDTDHDGFFEKQILDFLQQNSFKGLLLLDDIYFNDAMLKFWQSIDMPKFDLTKIGHGKTRQRGTPTGKSGTGMVAFGGQHINVIT